MQNTANGAYALSGNTLGHDNTVTGYIALSRNTTGIDNTANGSSALGMNPTGDANTAVGFAALDLLTHGNSNTAIGANALDAISDGGQNIALGSFAGGLLNSGDYNIYIGSSGASFDNGTIRIGDPTFHSATYVAGIYGQTASPGIQVYINSDGQLGTVVSSERFKKDIAGMENASDAILSLRPVTFHYKTDSKGTPQFGLVAEEVAKVNPALVLPDKEGKPYTVRYDAVNAMLLNEFLKEHRRVEEQGATIAQLKQDFQSRLSAQQKQIERLTAGLQKVSAQLELSKTAPQTVLNRQ
jgi:hypothetical protein